MPQAPPGLIESGIEDETGRAERGANVLCAPARPGSTLLVAFSGHWGHLAMPVFEFGRLTEHIEASRLLLREPYRAWYHRGIPEAGPDILSICSLLERHMREVRPGSVVAFGVSAGGYAALLFGALLGFDEVHALAPQTTLTRWDRLRMLDRRWRRDIAQIYRTSPQNRTFRDLRRVLPRRETGTTFHVHYCRANRLDSLHAERLGDLPGVVLHSYPAGGHRLARWLHERGDLLRILERAVRR